MGAFTDVITISKNSDSGPAEKIQEKMQPCSLSCTLNLAIGLGLVAKSFASLALTYCYLSNHLKHLEAVKGEIFWACLCWLKK